MFRPLIALLLIVATQSLSADQGAGYLQGYAEALFDLRHQELGLKVERVREDGRIRVASQSCLSDEDQRAVRDSLLATRYFRQVKWTLPADCATASQPAMDAVQNTPNRIPARRVRIAPLPVDELFRPLMADPRQPQFSVKYHAYDSRVGDFNAASVSFGDYIGFVEGVFGESGFSQLGLQGAVFAVFNLDADSFDLVNADYWIGFPVSYRKGPWSFLTRIYHQSSHLGDEFLLGNPGINRINLSYEDFEVLASYDLGELRLYGGGGYILHSEPDLDPWHAQAGLEYRRPEFFSGWDLVMAADFQADQDTEWAPHRSYQAGFAFEGPGAREVRFMLEHFRGHSPNGQFWRDRLQYTGVGIYFDL